MLKISNGRIRGSAYPELTLTYCEKRGRGGEGKGKVDPLNLRITLYWKSGKKSKIN